MSEEQDKAFQEDRDAAFKEYWREHGVTDEPRYEVKASWDHLWPQLVEAKEEAALHWKEVGRQHAELQRKDEEIEHLTRNVASLGRLAQEATETLESMHDKRTKIQGAQTQHEQSTQDDQAQTET